MKRKPCDCEECKLEAMRSARMLALVGTLLLLVALAGAIWLCVIVAN